MDTMCVSRVIAVEWIMRVGVRNFGGELGRVRLRLPSSNGGQSIPTTEITTFDGSTDECDFYGISVVVGMYTADDQTSIPSFRSHAPYAR
jgi:hypothetical protein